MGFRVDSTPPSGVLVKAIIPSARDEWVAKVTEDSTAKPTRLEVSLWKNDNKVYEVPLNPAAPGEGITTSLKHVYTFSVIFDPDSTAKEIETAVLLIKDTTPHNTHGFMHDKSSIAVLAQAVLRLTTRVEQLEQKRQ